MQIPKYLFFMILFAAFEFNVVLQFVQNSSNMIIVQLEVACVFLFNVCVVCLARGLSHIASQRARNMQLLLRSFCFKLCSLLPIAKLSFDDGFRLRADSADDCGAAGRG